MCFPKNTKIGMVQSGSLGSRKGERHINGFRPAAPTLEQTFVKPLNAGRKPDHQLDHQQSELSVSLVN